ncbi:hypothetical protein MKX01_014047 [Papaver californicum]|nr:hypothetical protein MKX01_014047 [Papaver californicum]
MATKTLGVMQDENLHTQFRGPSRKALTNITNSSKLSPPKAASKKNLLKKSDNTLEQKGLYINPGFINSNMKSSFKGDTVGGKSKVSDGQKKAGLGGGGVRKALGDITNSRKLSLNQESKKNNPKKLNDIVDSFSSLKPLVYDEIPELLYEVRSPPRCRTPEHHITSPSMNRYALSPTLMLLGSP